MQRAAAFVMYFQESQLMNEGTAAGRLMRLIPDDGALATNAEGRRVVAAVALENGLVAPQAMAV